MKDLPILATGKGSVDQIASGQKTVFSRSNVNVVVSLVEVVFFLLSAGMAETRGRAVRAEAHRVLTFMVGASEPPGP